MRISELIIRVLVIVVVAVRIVDKAFLFKEISPAHLVSLRDVVQLCILVVAFKGVVLDVDLIALGSNSPDPAINLINDHADESDKLTSLDLFWVQII